MQATQPVEEEEAVSPSADGQPADAPYEEEQEDAEDGEEPEEPGPGLEAPEDDVSEPVKSGTVLKAFSLKVGASLLCPQTTFISQGTKHQLSQGILSLFWHCTKLTLH